MNTIKHFGFLLAFVILLSACQPATQTETPPSKDSEYSYGQNAIVESLEVMLLESFPLQAQVRVSGNLPNGCTELHEISVQQEGQEFILTLTTRQPTGDVACTEALVPFEEVVELDIEGLEAGSYTVIAQEEQAAFTLDVDNVIPQDVEEAEYEYGSNATVEAIAVNIMESDPVQVSVVLEGYLPDGCTDIEQVTASRDEFTFTIEIKTRRPAGDVMCTQQIVPFEETLNLDVEGLEEGLYTVQYGELSETFSLE
jgi:inhibitor of cysteine peptidase